MTWREGYGKLMPRGTRISFNMHYNAIGKEATDQTKVGFKFATTPVHTAVNTTIISNTTILIPPMVQNHEAIAAFQFPVEARVHGLRPHMHLRAREDARQSRIVPRVDQLGFADRGQHALCGRRVGEWIAFAQFEEFLQRVFFLSGPLVPCCVVVKDFHVNVL